MGAAVTLVEFSRLLNSIMSLVALIAAGLAYFSGGAWEFKAFLALIFSINARP
jgi:hypothetical protein